MFISMPQCFVPNTVPTKTFILETIKDVQKIAIVNTIIDLCYHLYNYQLLTIMQCPKNHPLVINAFCSGELSRKCDNCGTILSSKSSATCIDCDYDLCQECIHKKEQEFKGMQADPFSPPIFTGGSNSLNIPNLEGEQTYQPFPSYQPPPPSKLCKNGHPLIKGRSQNNIVACDVCNADIPSKESLYCGECNFDLCPKCSA